MRGRRQFVLGLSRGNTPAMLYRLLAEESYVARMPWDRTFVFWDDERWVPVDGEQSNQRMARNELLDRVSIPRENIRPILTVGIEPRDSAAAAERQFRALFKGEPRPDLMLPGIGVDGHAASLFPGTSALLEQEALFAANQVPQLDTWRITATLRLLESARHLTFLVMGSTQAAAMRQVLYSERDTVVLPASMVKPSPGKLTWLLDREAASLASAHALGGPAASAHALGGPAYRVYSRRRPMLV